MNVSTLHDNGAKKLDEQIAGKGGRDGDAALRGILCRSESVREGSIVEKSLSASEKNLIIQTNRSIVRRLTK